MKRNSDSKPPAKPRVERPRPRPSWLRWLRTGVAVIAAGVLPFVALELGLKAFHYGYPTEFFVPIAGKKASASNEKFGWRFFPPSIARVPVVSYVADQKPANTYRIFILGDSAAMGIPEPAFGFGRMLRVLLANRYPGAKFEVINTAMTAINSHVLLPIAADSARAQPDLFIILVGNNEVVGPYGPGTVLAGYSPSLSLVRAGIWFKSTRTAQLLEQPLAGFRKTDNTKEWEGMAMFLGHYVAEDDARLPGVYQNFRSNLEEASRIAHAAGAGVILSTVPVNLWDNPPFASLHRPDLTADDKSRWQKLYDQAVQSAESGQCQDAAGQFAEAGKIDDGFAELHYRLARCLVTLHKPAEAKAQFVRALNLDGLRFRADTKINQAIRDVAAAAGAGVQLADAQQVFEEAAGGELFYEHVHLNFAGNYLLANTILPRVEAALPETIRKHKQEGPLLSESQVADALVFTEWEHDRASMEMLGMMLQPPFTAQADFAARRNAVEGKLLGLKQKWAAAGQASSIRADYTRYVAALHRDPEDLDTREIFAEFLSKGGASAEAAEQFRALIDRVPDVARWHAGLGHEYAEAGQYAEARAEAASALRLDPQIAAAHFTLGYVLEHTGQPGQAITEYETGLRMKPDYADAYLRLGVILGREGRYREAVDHYAEFSKLAPGSADVENNMGVLLGRLGDVPGAVAHYREALRFRPEFPEVCNNLGAALERLGQMPEAIGYYQEALRLRPDFPEARQHLNAALARKR